MTQQLALGLNGPAPSRPVTRTGDPATSHQAAATVARTSALKVAILAALEDRQLTDGELVAYLRRGLFPHASESGIRSRRAELVAEGLVVDTRLRRLTPAGRETTVWGRR
jgi:hypothetical protein